MKPILILLIALNVAACTYSINGAPSYSPATSLPPQEVHLQWISGISASVMTDGPGERAEALALTAPDKTYLVEQAIANVSALGQSTDIKSFYDLREPFVNGRYVGHTRWYFEQGSKCSVVELAKINAKWKVASWDLHECNAIQDTVLMSDTLPILMPTSTPHTK